MKITKFGHCCLIIEEGDLRIITDPGGYNELFDVSNLDLVIITHDHSDHLHIESLKKIISANPDIKILTTEKVKNMLKEENIECEVLKDKDIKKFKEITIEGTGELHAPLLDDIEPTENVGIIVNNKLYYPGDNFFIPQNKVDVVAMPFSAPWLKLQESINFVKAMNPKITFPVHDGNLKFAGSVANLTKEIIGKLGIKYIIPEINQPFDIE